MDTGEAHNPHHDDSGVITTLGNGRVVHSDPETGDVEMTFEARPEFCHPGGVQGGFITGWLDSAMAHAVMVRSGMKLVPATLEIKVSFLRPVMPNQSMHVKARIVRYGRSIVFLEGELRDAKGRLAATGSSSGKLVPGGGAGVEKVR